MSLSSLLAVSRGQAKAKTPFLNFKGHTALLIIVGLFAKVREAESEAGQSVLQTGIVSTDGDDDTGLIKVFLRGLTPPSRIEAQALNLAEKSDYIEPTLLEKG